MDHLFKRLIKPLNVYERVAQGARLTASLNQEEDDRHRLKPCLTGTRALRLGFPLKLTCMNRMAIKAAKPIGGAPDTPVIRPEDAPASELSEISSRSSLDDRPRPSVRGDTKKSKFAIDLQSRFEEWFGHRLPRINIVANRASTAFLEKKGAAAASVAETILLPQDMHASTSGREQNVLAHELVHVMQYNDNALQASPTTARREILERDARLRAKDMIDGNDSRMDSRPIPVSHVKQPVPSPLPKNVDSGRIETGAAPILFSEKNETGLGEEEKEARTPETKIDWSLLKDELYRDLMARIRIEFERGA